MSLAHAQVVDLGKCSVNQVSKDGLQQMKTLIGDARIVVLSEQVHGVGTDYESFAFMVKFLHEEMGFNVLAQEYCFYTFDLFNSGSLRDSSAQKFSQGMYWPQGKSKENDLLFDYIDEQKETENPLIMEGFDPRIFQRKSFYNYCDSLLNKSRFDLLSKNAKANFLGTLDNLLKLEYKDTLTLEDEKVEFLKNVDDIIAGLEPESGSERIIQIMRNVKSFAKNAWNADGYDINDFDRFHERDRQMAENIFWLAEEVYPNQKIILRMHNGHAAKNIHVLKGCVPDRFIKSQLNVGSRLNERYGETCVHIASTYYSGTYCGWDFKEKTIPEPRKNSIEAKLHKKGYEYAFVDLRKKRKFYMFANEFNSWVEGGEIKAEFGAMFDGIIFIDAVKMPSEK
jgi:erythromycin esterase